MNVLGFNKEKFFLHNLKGLIEVQVERLIEWITTRELQVEAFIYS